MGLFVIATFRPRPGKEQQLLTVLRDHMPTLRSQSLITDRPAYVMRAKDGTILEVFEWKSAEAIEQAHTNPVVGKLWGRFVACCEYGTLSSVEESKQMFPNFEPIAP
jgi:hypothetical protein